VCEAEREKIDRGCPCLDILPCKHKMSVIQTQRHHKCGCAERDRARERASESE
jgi:hypothetical protein